MYEKSYYILTNKFVRFSDNDFRYFIIFWQKNERISTAKNGEWKLRLWGINTRNYVRNSIEVFMTNFERRKINNGRILMKILMDYQNIIFSENELGDLLRRLLRSS